MIQNDGGGSTMNLGGGVLSPNAIFRKRQPSAYNPYVSKSGGSSVASSGTTAIAGGGGGGGGGGGYSADDGGGYGGGYAAPAPPPRRSLADVIAADWQRRQIEDENKRQLGEYDSESTRLRGETERDQAVQREDLKADLGQMSLDSSEDLAGRGLLNSGGLFVQQDEINQTGERREDIIAKMLTQLLQERGQGRTNLQAQGRNALNERIAKINDDYASGVGGY